MLVLRPGIKPLLPALAAQSPNHWTTGEVPRCVVFKGNISVLILQTGSSQISYEFLQYVIMVHVLWDLFLLSSGVILWFLEYLTILN